MTRRRLTARSKRTIVAASILVSIAIGVPHLRENWDKLLSQGPVFVVVYLGLAGLFMATGAALARRVALGRRLEHSVPAAVDARRLLVVNGAAAVGMGVTVVVAAVRLLPVASWPVPFAICAIDIVHTVWSRRYLIVSSPTSEPSSS